MKITMHMKMPRILKVPTDIEEKQVGEWGGEGGPVHQSPTLAPPRAVVDAVGSGDVLCLG